MTTFHKKSPLLFTTFWGQNPKNCIFFVPLYIFMLFYDFYFKSSLLFLKYGEHIFK